MGRKSRGRGQGHRSRPGRGALWSGASVGGHRPRADQSRRASRQVGVVFEISCAHAVVSRPD